MKCWYPDDFILFSFFWESCGAESSVQNQFIDNICKISSKVIWNITFLIDVMKFIYHFYCSLIIESNQLIMFQMKDYSAKWDDLIWDVACFLFVQLFPFSNFPLLVIKQCNTCTCITQFENTYCEIQYVSSSFTLVPIFFLDFMCPAALF